MNLPALAHTATNPTVFIHDGKVVTTSTAVAEYFQKRHDDVIRKIRSVMADCDGEYRLRNFTETFYNRENPNGGAGIATPMYELTRDAFVLIVMGFTGKKALQWKISYISEFNRMESELNNKPRSVPDIYRYQVRVIIHDEATGMTAELRGESNDLRNVAFGICTDLGYKPNSFTHVPPKPQIKKLH